MLKKLIIGFTPSSTIPSILSISVPPSYSYLPEHSFLRALTDFLQEAAKQGKLIGYCS
jgi:hypothetical protein